LPRQNGLIPANWVDASDDGGFVIGALWLAADAARGHKPEKQERDLLGRSRSG